MFTAAGSPRLLRTFNGVAAELRLLIAQLRPATCGAQELAEEHAVLLQVLQGGQLAPVLQAWHHHLDIAEQFFLDLIRERDR